MRPTADQREAVAKRADYRCEYCQCPSLFSSDPFSVDHIIPQAKGGPTELSNLALACEGCNGLKITNTEGIDPASQESTLLFNPREQVWSEHFVWSADLLEIIGLTPTGRTTVSKLQLNRLGLLNLRRVLARCGEHPAQTV